jgi:hypothetical protein
MGLDMYLTAEVYLSEYEDYHNGLMNAIKQNAIKGLNDYMPEKISYQLAYWRKANAIHGWFVKNVQQGVDDCGKYYVDIDTLEKLRDDCGAALKDKDKGRELLPATKGFFFGEYDYNERYDYAMADTLRQINKILENPNSRKWYITYQSSW